jgi:putative Holliday junction resolvase
MLERYQRILAFDFGMKRIGVASAQIITGTASPQPPISAQDGIPHWEKLDACVTEWLPDALIVGLPLNMDDTESHLTHLARKFAHRLHARYRLPVFMADERLSSFTAKGLLKDTIRHPNRKQKSIDSTAAVIIAETWLSEPSENRP